MRCGADETEHLPGFQLWGTGLGATVAGVSLKVKWEISRRGWCAAGIMVGHERHPAPEIRET